MLRTAIGLCVTLGTSAICAAHPSSDPEVALLSAVRARVKSLEACSELSSVDAAKTTVTMQVQPAGDVTDVRVDSAAPLSLATCMAVKIRNWRFTPFTGEARQITYPVLFVASQKN